jgi:hypothetical protein
MAQLLNILYQVQKQVNLLTFNTRFDETLEPLARMESFAKYLQALLL